MGLFLDETAVLLGSLHLVERSLFEILGGWVASTPEPSLKAWFAELSYHHASHAQHWADRFPRGYSFDLATSVQAAAIRLGPALSAVAAPTSTAERVIGYARGVLPITIDTYEGWDAAHNPCSEGPVHRSLTFVLTDLHADRHAAEIALRGLVNGERGSERYLEVSRGIVEAFSTVGGLAGGLQWEQVHSRWG